MNLVPKAYEVVVEVIGFRLSTVRVTSSGQDVDVGTIVLDVGPIEDPTPCRYIP